MTVPMNEKIEKERINWLGTLLGSQRTNISSLLDRLRGIAVRVGNSLPLHKKFMLFLDQVATDREKELDIINEIESIEKKHRELKQMRLLRRADSIEGAARKRRLKELERENQQKDNEDENSPHRLDLLEIFCVLLAVVLKVGFFLELLRFLFKEQSAGRRAHTFSESR